MTATQSTTQSVATIRQTRSRRQSLNQIFKLTPVSLPNQNTTSLAPSLSPSKTASCCKPPYISLCDLLFTPTDKADTTANTHVFPSRTRLSTVSKSSHGVLISPASPRLPVQIQMRNHHRRLRERDLLSENRDQELSPDDEEDDETSVIYTARRSRSNQDIHRHTSTRVSKDAQASGFRAFLSMGIGWRKPKSEQITTAIGQLGAGETETEADEPPRHLPTARILPASEPLVPTSTMTSLLFEASRLLSVVPASLGALINAWCVLKPPGMYLEHSASNSCSRIIQEPGSWGRITLPDRADYFIAVLWALLTAHQCLRLTSGLLHRWRAYYAPLSTLIRLLALQAICWPATHFTLDVLGGLGFNVDIACSTVSTLDSKLLGWTTIRPDVCWAVIGTTTCVSRSIQIWVTSNLLPSDAGTRASAVPEHLRPHVKLKGEETRKLVGRRWDWGIVARACMLPAGCLYFVMAWIGVWRKETLGC